MKSKDGYAIDIAPLNHKGETSISTLVGGFACVLIQMVVAIYSLTKGS